MAMVIPVRVKGSKRGPQLLLIILTPDNLERMKEGDPFDLQTRAYEDQFDLDGAIRDLDIVVAYEKDEAPLIEMARAGDLGGILRHVERGRRHKPGDAAKPVRVRIK